MRRQRLCAQAEHALKEREFHDHSHVGENSRKAEPENKCHHVVARGRAMVTTNALTSGV
jgi:hypothetical protein